MLEGETWGCVFSIPTRIQELEFFQTGGGGVGQGRVFSYLRGELCNHNVGLIHKKTSSPLGIGLKALGARFGFRPELPAT